MRRLSLAVLVAASAALPAAEPDLVVADFEGTDYAGWTATGTAFGDRPARGTLRGQMPVTGFKGKGLVNSFLGGDGSTGTLTSQPFTIERDFLNFLIGGGGFEGKTCLNLLQEGKVVRTATGPNTDAGGSEELAAVHWNVKELRGKTVTLQVVDAATGGWGHVNVDHIVQSDTKQGAEGKVTPAVDRTRELAVTGKYLLFPIRNAAKPVRMTVEVDGKRVHDFDINLAPDTPDWWARLDVPEHVGKTAKVTALKVAEDNRGIDRIESADSIRHAQPVYREALRPQLRFSQMQGWNNDPNGMVYHDGEYHLFWQSNPFGPKWGNMYWGHAVSKDLVRWEERPYALYPRVMAKSHCFSGSAHIDERNTGGWGAGAMVAAFTDTGAGECLAVSTDKGRTWNYIPENPVIPLRKDEGRDPKLIWYEPGRHWVIVAFTKTDKKDYAEFFTSTDLKKWEKASRIEGYYECPELFELPVDGGAKKWVLMAADAKYAVGTFDGRTFTPDHPGKHRVHHGAFYAAQCFSRTPGRRVIQVGWAQVETPNMPFNQAFSLPIELTLRKSTDGVRLFAEPVRELETLRGEATTTACVAVKTGMPARVKTPDPQLLDIVAEIDPGNAAEVKLTFGANTLTYKAADRTLDGMPLPAGKVFAVRVVVDRPMYEVVGGSGLAYKTAPRKDGGKPIETIEVSVVGGTATVAKLSVYPMRSIWAK